MNMFVHLTVKGHVRFRIITLSFAYCTLRYIRIYSNLNKFINLFYAGATGLRSSFRFYSYNEYVGNTHGTQSTVVMESIHNQTI